MKRRQVTLFGCFLLTLCACAESKKDAAASAAAVAATPQTFSMSGLVQKGPFVQGSSITIQELDQNLAPTGVSYQTQTTDSSGAFKIESHLKSSFVEIIASGYYYNEVSGFVSDSTLTLRVYADLSVNTNVNVNVLTSIAHDRIKTLVLQGLKFSDASAQAKAEILSLFHEVSGATQDFSQMDIGQPGVSNAVLLTSSVILQGSNTVGQLSEFLAQLGSDLATNGRISDGNAAQLLANAAGLDLGKIRSNLQKRYVSLRMTAQIPDFEATVAALLPPRMMPSPPPPTPTPILSPSAPLKLTNQSALARLFYNSNPNNPETLTVTFDVASASDSLVVRYTDGGVIHEAGFGTTHPNGAVSDSSLNHWYDDLSTGNRVWKGFFQDSYGAVIVIVDRVTSQGDGQADLVGGSIWFQNFNRYYPNFGTQGPLKMCWQISMGPYDCRSFLNSDRIDPASNLYPNNRGPDANMNYEKLGDFDGVLKSAAGF